MSLSPGVHVLTTGSPYFDHILSQIVWIHATCIRQDHTIATFIPPLSFDRMHEHWSRLMNETESQKRIVLIHLSATTKPEAAQQQGTSSSSALPNPFDEPAATKIISSKGDLTSSGLALTGTASLALPASETGPFRGLIGNIFVSPDHRRKGIARQLLAAVEKSALESGRWNLMLDTTVGTEAEHVYPKLGWERLGVVRDYGISPRTGELVDEVFYVKDLRKRDLSNNKLDKVLGSRS